MGDSEHPMIDRLDRQVEELWRRQGTVEGKVAVIEAHLINMDKSITNINANVNKFVWAVFGILLVGVMNLLLK